MLGDILGNLIDIIYPRTCVVCAKSLKNTRHIDKLVCAHCWSSIKKNRPPFCRSCGRHLEKKSLNKHICPACIRKRLDFDRAYSCCAYEGVVKELIREFKYKGKDYLGQTLSRLMIEFITEFQLPIQDLDMIIPVPLHAAKFREREFNQAHILSRHIAERFDKAIVDDQLMRHRQTRTQTELQDQERFLNVKDSFSVKEDNNLKGKNILLIDDVLTTAATSSEAAGALKRAGANIVFVLTLAN